MALKMLICQAQLVVVYCALASSFWGFILLWGIAELPFSIYGFKISMGNGKSVVVFFSNPISRKVCR